MSETSLGENIGLILGTKKITDEEVREDAAFLQEKLSSNERELSSVDRYRRDLEACRFSWSSPVHSSEFWAENYLAFEAGDFKLLRDLAALLQSKDADAVTRAIACFDVGEFAVNHPQGKYMVMRLGVKEKVLACLEDADDGVKRQALLAMSKMMVNKWQFLTVSADAEAAKAAAGAKAGKKSEAADEEAK